MNASVPTLTYTAAERARVETIAALGRKGATGVAALVQALEDPSWAVRRSAVTTLARLGNVAVQPLCAVLRTPRTSEVLLAAAVEALVASVGDVDRPVLELAADADPAIVADAAQILGRRHSSRAAPVLAALTTHADDNIAVAAIEALGRIHGTVALEALTNVLDGRIFFRCLPAIEVLGHGGDPRAIDALVGLLPEQPFARDAARALGRIGEVAAVGPLAHLLSRTDDGLVRTVAVALAEIDDRLRSRFGVSDLVGNAITKSLADAVEAGTAARNVRRCLEGGELHEQAALCRVLGWLGGDEGVSTLIDLLGGAAEIAPAAADALARIDRTSDPLLFVALRGGDSAQRLRLLPLLRGRPASTGDVVLCLADPDADVRTRACEILGRDGDAASLPALFDLLNDSDARVAQAAAAAIQSLGGPETERLVTETAQKGPQRSRRAALRIIAHFGYPRALPILLACVDDADEKIRDAAICALAFIDHPQAFEALMTAAVHPVATTRASAMRAFGHATRGPKIAERLIAGLSDPQPWVRYYACQALGRLRETSAIEALAGLLHDPAGQVLVAVVEALSLLEGVSAAAALREAAASADPDVQRAAFLGIALARLQDAIPLLLSGLGSSDPATRVVALSALAQFDHPDAARAVLQAAIDGDENLRSAALGFVATRGGLAATAGLVELLATPVLRESVVVALSLRAPGRIAGILFALETADEERSELLISALTRMNRDDARAAIVVVLGFDAAPPRRAAIAALTAINTSESRAALLRASRYDADPALRRLASLGLVR